MSVDRTVFKISPSIAVRCQGALAAALAAAPGPAGGAGAAAFRPSVFDSLAVWRDSGKAGSELS